MKLFHFLLITNN